MTENDKVIKPNKYHNGKIYTIRCRDDDTLIYVGSSCLPLHKRFYQHKQKMKQEKYKNAVVYKKMNELGVDKFYIELYELFKCDIKEELTKREGEVIRQISTLNKRIEGRTQKEYDKERRQIPEVKLRNKEYDKKRREIPEVKLKFKEYDAQRRQKPERIEYMKQYKLPILCECGCNVIRSAISSHRRTKKHIAMMNKLNDTSNNIEVVV